MVAIVSKGAQLRPTWAGTSCSREPNRLNESVRILVWRMSCAMNVPTRAHELIMVMGAQRSGTICSQIHWQRTER